MSIFAIIKEKVAAWKQHRLGKVLLNKYFIVGAIFLVWICFLDTNNVGQLIRTRITLRNQRRQIEFYNREITKMDRKIEQLQSQRDTLE